MLSYKSVLLERINHAISKKWSQKAGILFNLNPGIEKDGIHPELLNPNQFAHSKHAASIERLEKRAQVLEQQCDQLLYFINFMVENLPELVLKTLSTELETRNGHSTEEERSELSRDTLASLCCEGKTGPCPTRREKDVLELLVKGFCAKEIANRLYISETTVVTHKKNLKEKFNARNTAELISKAQPHITNVKM